LGLASSDKKGEISDANLLVSPKELEGRDQYFSHNFLSFGL